MCECFPQTDEVPPQSTVRIGRTPCLNVVILSSVLYTGYSLTTMENNTYYEVVGE